MSHSHERAEKVCLNCQSEVYGRYCHVCGQENVEPKETAWGMIVHFFNDITHFDGKFFQTLKYLIIRPGFLSKEYMEGRRMKYLHPIRMYVFTSFVFFLSFYSIANVDNWDFAGDAKVKTDANEIALAEAEARLLKEASTHEDSLRLAQAFKVMDKLPVPVTAVIDSSDSDDDSADGLQFGVSFLNTNYKSKQEYDSLQKLLPAESRDGWFERRQIHRRIKLKEKYGENEKRFWQDVLNKFIHSFPSLLFVSLPLYALFLKLLYIRRKKYYYVDHGIFLIHLYIFTFIVLLALFGLIKLDEATNTSLFGWLIAALLVYGLIYTIRAMKNFYEQRWLKTLIKFFLFNVLATIALSLLFVLFFVLTIFRA